MTFPSQFYFPPYSSRNFPFAHFRLDALRYFCDGVKGWSIESSSRLRLGVSEREGKRLSLFSRSAIISPPHFRQTRRSHAPLIPASSLSGRTYACHDIPVVLLATGPYIVVRLVRSHGDDSRELEDPWHGCLLTCCSLPPGRCATKVRIFNRFTPRPGATRTELFYWISNQCWIFLKERSTGVHEAPKENARANGLADFVILRFLF